MQGHQLLLQWTLLRSEMEIGLRRGRWRKGMGKHSRLVWEKKNASKGKNTFSPLSVLNRLLNRDWKKGGSKSKRSHQAKARWGDSKPTRRGWGLKKEKVTK